MGHDKALVVLLDRSAPLIAHVDRVLSEVARGILLATSDPEPYAFLGRPHVADARAGCGPLAGLVAGLDALEGNAVVCVAPCDLPFVTADAYRALVRALLDDPSADAVVPTTDKGDEPLVAAYRPRAARVLRHALDAGRLAVHEAIADLAVRRVAAAQVAPEWTFFNVNDRQQMLEAQRRAGARTVGAAS